MITIDTIMVNFLPNRSLNLPPIKDPKSNPNIIIVPRNNLLAFLSHTYNFDKYYVQGPRTRGGLGGSDPP